MTVMFITDLGPLLRAILIHRNDLHRLSIRIEVDLGDPDDVGIHCEQDVISDSDLR